MDTSSSERSDWLEDYICKRAGRIAPAPPLQGRYAGVNLYPRGQDPREQPWPPPIEEYPRDSDRPPRKFSQGDSRDVGPPISKGNSYAGKLPDPDMRERPGNPYVTSRLADSTPHRTTIGSIPTKRPRRSRPNPLYQPIISVKALIIAAGCLLLLLILLSYLGTH